MRIRRDDEVRLRHMLDAAHTAMRLACGRTRRDLAGDEMLRLSLMKSVEMIGESASRVSEATQRKNPSIPWSRIVGMRNRLVHVYFDIDLDVLWQTVTNDIPLLIAQLEPITPPETR